MANDPMAYLTDYWTTDDNLRFSDFRPALFDILTEAHTPLTVGVFGPWGSGKTSLLRMLKEDVDEKRSPFLRAVWFTAWKYDRHEVLWQAFILRVLDALYPREEGDEPWEKRERIPAEDLVDEKQRKQIEHLDRLARSVYGAVEWDELGQWVMAWDKAGKELAKLPAFLLLLSVRAEKIADMMGISPDVAELVQREVQNHRLEQLTSMEQFESTFLEVLPEILGEDGRLIVFVDDLDRCLPEKAVEVLEAIKLFLEVPRTVFVLGMAQTVIERGIEARYKDFLRPEERGEEEGQSEFPISGASYIQKIVQIPFHLPPLRVDDVSEYIVALENKMPPGARLDEMTAEVFAHGLLPNPRQAKRALNIFRLLKKIAKKREMDVAWPLLAKTVLIQTQWPELYRDWRQHPMLVRTLEGEYARQPFSEKEFIRGRSIPADLDEGMPQADGLLGPYLRKRRKYALLERMLAFPDLAESETGHQQVRFEGLGLEEMETYVRLVGAVGTEEQVISQVPADRLIEMLSGDRALVEEAAAWLEQEEPELDGPQHIAWRERLLRVIGDPTQPAEERISAGDALALIGDCRFLVDLWHLPEEPMLGFVEIPGGSFLMGTRKEEIPSLAARFGRALRFYEHETPQQDVDLRTFYIARYPVTVAQFQAFVEASDYQLVGERSSQRFGNHPVVEVTWYDAVEYCKWLTNKLQDSKQIPEPLAALLQQEGWVVALPDEAEWEKAAQGTDDQEFPWGEDADPNRANYRDTRIGTTSTVGCFPSGASSYGVEDLSGNVWEWTRSRYVGYPYHPEDGRERLNSGDDEGRVLRGGAFDLGEASIRCRTRYRFEPSRSWFSSGFRVAIVPASATR